MSCYLWKRHHVSLCDTWKNAGSDFSPNKIWLSEEDWTGGGAFDPWIQPGPGAFERVLGAGMGNFITTKLKSSNAWGVAQGVGGGGGGGWCVSSSHPHIIIRFCTAVLLQLHFQQETSSKKPQVRQNCPSAWNKGELVLCSGTHEDETFCPR